MRIKDRILKYYIKEVMEKYHKRYFSIAFSERNIWGILFCNAPLFVRIFISRGLRGGSGFFPGLCPETELPVKRAEREEQHGQDDQRWQRGDEEHQQILKEASRSLQRTGGPSC